MAEKFMFFRSYREALECLPEADQLRLLLAMIDYGLDGVEPSDLSGAALAVFRVARPILDQSRTRSADGSRGGRPTKKKMLFEPQKGALQIEKSPLLTEEKRKKEEEIEAEGKEPTRAFPSLEEIMDFVEERGSPVDPLRFFDYYNAAGWIDGQGQPVHNWQQKLISWERSERSDIRQSTGGREIPAEFNIPGAALD